MGFARLNNQRLSNQRKEVLYEAIMTDLVLMGALTKEMVEPFIGHEVPDYLTVPKAVTKTVAAAVVEAPVTEAPAETVWGDE